MTICVFFVKEVLNAVDDKQALDCEELLEVLAAESEQEFQREAVQEDLRKGMTTALGENYDHELIQALRLLHKPLSKNERCLHFCATPSERA